jgi:hypothetical protein
MNSSKATKAQRIINAEKNLQRRYTGTTEKGHPKSLKYHKRYEQLGNGKKRHHKV